MIFYQTVTSSYEQFVCPNEEPVPCTTFTVLFRFYLAETRGHGINFQEARALEEERRDPVYPPQECHVGCMLYCKKDCRRMCCYRK